MPETTESPRAMLKEYADTLVANAQAATEEERDEIADDLIEITGKMEASRERDSATGIRTVGSKAPG